MSLNVLGYQSHARLLNTIVIAVCFRNATTHKDVLLHPEPRYRLRCDSEVMLATLFCSQGRGKFAKEPARVWF